MNENSGLSSERLVEVLEQSISDYVFVYDRDGRYLDMVFGRRTTGQISPDEMVGAHVEDVLPPEAAELVLETVQRVIDEGVTETIEYGVESDSMTRYYEAIVTPASVDDEIAVLIARDVTELRQRRDRLRRKNRQLERLASILSHDIKTPMGTATGSLELLERSLDPGTEAKRHLDRLSAALDRMSEMTEDALVLARIETSDPEFEPVPVEEITQLSWSVTDTTDATLSVPESFTIHGHRRSLRHLFENLFANCRDHCGPAVAVRVEPTPDGFAVEDDGPGIPDDRREAVFELGESSVDGNGIGLAVVRTVTDLHGWSVRIEESDAGGTRFVFSGVQLGSDE